jgi:hypothetical protein
MTRRFALMLSVPRLEDGDPVENAKQARAECNKFTDLNTTRFSCRHISDQMHKYYTSADWFESQKEARIPNIVTEVFIRKDLFVV